MLGLLCLSLCSSVVFGFFFVVRFFCCVCCVLCVVCCAWLDNLRSLLSSTGTWSVVDDNDLKKSRHTQTQGTSKSRAARPTCRRDTTLRTETGNKISRKMCLLQKTHFRSANWPATYSWFPRVPEQTSANCRVANRGLSLIFKKKNEA